jgi:oligoendopeptidase F
MHDDWVDAEPQPGKSAGGFCASFPRSRQSRIYLSFGPTGETLYALAHELGHAYHNHLLHALPPAHQHPPPVLLETASTFAEGCLRGYLGGTLGRAEQLSVLEPQLTAGWRFLMDAPARFMFERRLYHLPRRGGLAAAQLSDELLDCQRQCFGEALESYDPRMWVARPLFYLPDTSFCNWHYTFGFLFAKKLSAMVSPRQDAEDTLDRFLKKTGVAAPASLAEEFFGGDIHDAAFWAEAADPFRQELEAFLDATGEDG